MATTELLINIVANAGSATAVMNELTQQTRLLEQVMANTTKATGAGAAAAASAMDQFMTATRAALPAALELAAAGAAITAGFGSAVQTAAQFDTAMVAIRNNTTMTNADADLMRQTVLRLGAESPASLEQLGQGFMHISNLGFSAKDSVVILEAAMKSAVSTGGNTAETANILAQAMHEFGIPAAGAAQTMDMLHMAAAEGNMTLEEFSKSFGVLAAWAAAVGVPLDQAAAAMSAMTRHGFDAAQAATQVKDEIAHLINPSAQARSAIEGLGNSIGKDLSGVLTPAELHAKGLTGVINEITTAMNMANLSTDQQTALWLKIIPNMRGGAAGFVLAGRGADDFSAILTDLHAKLGVTDEAFARMKDTAGFQWGEFTNKMQELGIAIGSILLPPLLKIVDTVAVVVGWLTQLPVPIQTTIGFTGAFAGILLSAVGALGAMAWALMNLVSGFVAVRTAMAAMGGSATAASAEVATLTGAEVASGDAALAAAPKFAAFGQAAAGAVVGVLALGSALALLWQGSAQSDQLKTLDKVAQSLSPDQAAELEQRTKAITDATNKQTGGLYGNSGSVQIAAREQALRDMGLDPAQLMNEARTQTPATAAATSVAAVPPVTLPDLEGPTVRSAKAAKDSATAQLQVLQDAQAQRKADFAINTVDAETELLALKNNQVVADLAQLKYKQQIEDLDRNSINFAQKRLQLEEQANVLHAQMAEGPLKAQNEDIRYQEDRIKAELKAAHAGGPAVDTGALHKQLHDLVQQDARMQPALLDAQHNVTLANRAKTTTDQQAGLDKNAVDQKKLDIEEQMRPATEAAVLATRAVQDAQKLLDLDKLRYDIAEKSYSTALLMAEAARKAAEHVLFMLQHQDAGIPQRSPSDIVLPNDPHQLLHSTSPANLGLPDDPRQSAGPLSHPAQPGSAAQAPVFQFNIGQVGQSAEQIWDGFRAQFIAAWNAAMSGHPVSNSLGGNYSNTGRSAG